jgi:hypothetical protein
LPELSHPDSIAYPILPHPTRSTRTVIWTSIEISGLGSRDGAAFSTVLHPRNFQFRGIGRRKGRLPVTAFRIIRVRAENLKGGPWPKSSTENWSRKTSSQR